MFNKQRRNRIHLIRNLICNFLIGTVIALVAISSTSIESTASMDTNNTTSYVYEKPVTEPIVYTNDIKYQNEVNVAVGIIDDDILLPSTEDDEEVVTLGYEPEPPVEVKEEPVVEETPPTRELNLTCISQSSNLSEDQMNTLIDNIMTRYHIKNSMFKGKGNIFVEMERKCNVNAIFIMAIGMTESTFGSYSGAIRKNNPFGIMAKKGIKYFSSIENCIYYEGELMRNKYFDSGRDTIHSVGKKYCATSSWGDKVSSFFNTFANMVY